MAVDTPPPSPPVHGWGWGRWAWRTLTSMRTAVTLLALLAIAAIPGSLLPQRNVATDPNAVPMFYQEHPGLAPWLDRLSLFNVYSSPWFAAIYVLLLVSMTGCVLPRSARLWRELRAAPPAAPRRLERMEHHRQLTVDGSPGEIIARAESVLRSRRYRVVTTEREVWAEKGYSRELGNLVFHLSLLVLLVGIATGKLYGFEGRAALVEGETFTNVRSSYDEFTPAALTDIAGLTPFSVTLDRFETEFALLGPRAGEPRRFDAMVTYSRDDAEPATATIKPNEPLDMEGTKLFVSGHGYAPQVTVRDGRGEVVFSGAAVFLPLDMSLTSDGVIKAPNAQPAQLGFEGLLLPTAFDATGTISQFPGLLEPRLDLVAYSGDLGMGSGPPQSVFALQKDDLEEIGRQSLRIGDTMRLPDGAGSITFDGVARFANFQIAFDPGKEISLVASILLMVGLTMSLVIRRRRLWLRLSDSGTGIVVDMACRSLTRRTVSGDHADELMRELAALGSTRIRSSV
ncbi:MAG: cytochrome c biogenesis protein ResB [Nocardioidaceae bacterium]|nr:MAG: cytochrome c biogenesis protein ResB [Nocardioidaceae bacterium]